MLAVVHFIYFSRILQKLSKILLPSRQNWTKEVWFFLQNEDNWWKYLSQLVLSSYFAMVCLNENNCLLLISFLHGFKGWPCDQGSNNVYSGHPGSLHPLQIRIFGQFDYCLYSLILEHYWKVIKVATWYILISSRLIRNVFRIFHSRIKPSTM